MVNSSRGDHAVSCFTPQGGETVKHAFPICNNMRNKFLPMSLKGLAHRVLREARQCNSNETEVKQPASQECHVCNDFEERAAIIEAEANLPREWAKAFARMDNCHRPHTISQIQWQHIIHHTGIFLDRFVHDAVEKDGM